MTSLKKFHKVKKPPMTFKEFKKKTKKNFKQYRIHLGYCETCYTHLRVKDSRYCILCKYTVDVANEWWRYSRPSKLCVTKSCTAKAGKKIKNKYYCGNCAKFVDSNSAEISSKVPTAQVMV